MLFNKMYSLMVLDKKTSRLM